MGTQTVRLIDQSQNVLAVAHLADEDEFYGGTIDLNATPEDVRALFAEFEEIVNGQMLSFLDDIQEHIDALPIKAAFDDGLEVPLRDLQVFPSTGEVSFKLVEVPSRSASISGSPG